MYSSLLKKEKHNHNKNTLWWIVMFITALLWLLETSKSKIAGPPNKLRNLKPSIHGKITRRNRGEGCQKI